MAAKEKNENEELKPENDRQGLRLIYLLFGVLIAIIAGIIGFFVALFGRSRRYF
jgi:flagellar basal body-associated protein FliL